MRADSSRVRTSHAVRGICLGTASSACNVSTPSFLRSIAPGRARPVRSGASSLLPQNFLLQKFIFLLLMLIVPPAPSQFFLRNFLPFFGAEKEESFLNYGSNEKSVAPLMESASSLGGVGGVAAWSPRRKYKNSDNNGHRSARYHHYHNRFYKPRRYHITLSIRNHNVTEARFFRLVGVDNTVDFHVGPGKIFTNTYEVNRKGYWTLFVEFPGDRYAKSPRKIISRDSFSHWIMEVYFYPESVGFSEWHKMHKIQYDF